MVNKFTISSVNYHQAWETLTSHYDKKRYTVFSLIREFIDQPAISSVTAQTLNKLVTSSDEIVQQLDALGNEVRTRDPWLIHLILEKLDKDTRVSWSQKIVDSDNPSFEELLSFLKQRCEMLETCSAFSKKPSSDVYKKEQNKTMVIDRKLKALHTTTLNQKCAKCSKEHHTYQCAEFKELNLQDRKSVAQKGKLCFNCLRPFHSAKSCSSKQLCHTPNCNQRLCPMVVKAESVKEDSVPVHNTAEIKDNVIASLSAELPVKEQHTIPVLPTTIVLVQKTDGNLVPVRALIDSGSQATLITEECVRKLNLPRSSGKLAVSGLGQQEVGTTRGIVTLQLASRFKSVIVLTAKAYILGKLTSTIPSQRFRLSNMTLLSNLDELADPTFNKPSPIDIILGSDVFLALLEGGQVKDESGLTVAQRTIFGWIIAGRFDEAELIRRNHAIISLHMEMDLNRTLRQFWEQEEMFKPPELTPSEQKVMEHFRSTTQRDPSGRFIVRLPFDDSKPTLGESVSAALKRLLAMENRFRIQPEFKTKYTQFMAEYLELGHMEMVPDIEVNKSSSECYYLPHHAVIKNDSTTTKLRVVFDASSVTSTGVSLNDRLIAGPNNNQELFSVLVRFRSYSVAFSADVTKMYRQVIVHPADRDYQRILWRRNSQQPVQHYRLSTVTYGTKTAPFLAIEAMKEAARAYVGMYPEAAQRIERDFYVDDILSGADNESDAIRIKDQINKILSEAGFELRKWSSNKPGIVSEELSTKLTAVPVKLTEQMDMVKALGIHWLPRQDEFGFKVSLPTDSANTKRQMISDSAKLFDPFGWLTPVTVKMKILYQHLWLYDIGWDDPLPFAVNSEWTSIKNDLQQVESIRIPRFIAHCQGRVQLHGFSDASEQAYAAVVYSRTVDEQGNIRVALVAAKSRVAPIKQITLPRLELNGALLLTELLAKITEAVSHLDIEHWAWTDSTIVLQWLSSHPRRWKTYVANRTAAILEFLPRNRWNHVKSEDNPADCASRGLLPNEFVGHRLWFNGPAWLADNETYWKLKHAETVNNAELLEIRPVKSLHVVVTLARNNYDMENEILERRSSFKLIVHTLAYFNRFIYNLKSASENRRVGVLSPSELHQARAQLARAVQHETFASDIQQIRKGKQVVSTALLSLHPFLDEHGTMRVGGRLSNSDLPYDVKHPIILPQTHRATELLVRELHLCNLHAGPALLTAVINQKYWIIGIQAVVRRVVQGCIRCTRLKGKTARQLMGNLPPARVLATRAFAHVGIDYAGPLKIKAICVRGVKVIKGYIVVYVCLSTKAVHLEAASDMSTKTFLSSLKRFISRRGYPIGIWSDNGTNFVGADHVMKQFIEQIRSHGKEAGQFLSNLGIQWTYNPPSAPHMGGLWEAAVKSAKKHLVAEWGSEATTFEDLSTALCQIEACLNSRPLCALSSNPDCYDALTPGHFLIGQPMNLIPEPSLQRVPANRLNHWQEIQSRSERVWRRWKDEYITSLQPRKKWRTVQPNITIDQLVLVKNDNAPPTHWEIARVEQVHSDAAGIVRTVTLPRGQTTYQRPIHKLCVLPAY